MRLSRAEFEVSDTISVFGGVHEVLHQMDRIVEIPGVHIAGSEVKLSDEFGAKSGDVALKDETQIEVVAPVSRDVRIDDASGRIPDGLGITVGTDGTEDGLPDAELLGGAAVGTHDFFPADGGLHDSEDFARGVAHFGARKLGKRTLLPKRILILVDVDGLVGAKIDGIGAIGVGVVVKIGIEDLRGGGFPAPGGAPFESASPGLSDAAEALFDFRDKFLNDGVAVGTQVGGVHRIGIVVIGIRVLDAKDEHAGKTARGPILIEAVGILEILQVVGFGTASGFRSFFDKKFPVGLEMTLVDEQRIVCRGMLVETVGKEHGCAEIDGAAPEGGKELALNTDVLDVLGVFDGLDGGNIFGESEANDVIGLWIKVDELRLAEKIAGLLEPLLALAHVGRKFDGVAIGTMEGLVNIEDGLDIVVARRKLLERDERIAESCGVDHRGSSGLPGIDIETEELRALGFFFAELETGLRGFIGADAEKNVAVERLAIAGGIGKGDFDAKVGGRLGSGLSIERGR